MKWEFVYYSDRVQRGILGLPKALLAEFLAIKKVMQEKGAHLGMPYTRSMGRGLFEIRLNAKDGIARVFYCTIEKYEIFILHSFVKKTQKTPDHELKLARKRLKEVKQYG